jgi:hypothetical protein
MDTSFFSSTYERIAGSTVLTVLTVLMGLGILCCVLLLISHAVVEDYRLHQAAANAGHRPGFGEIMRILRQVMQSLHIR